MYLRLRRLGERAYSNPTSNLLGTWVRPPTRMGNATAFPGRGSIGGANSARCPAGFDFSSQWWADAAGSGLEADAAPYHPDNLQPKGCSVLGSTAVAFDRGTSEGVPCGKCKCHGHGLVPCLNEKSQRTGELSTTVGSPRAHTSAGPAGCAGRARPPAP
jgi:hypothetical protein